MKTYKYNFIVGSNNKTHRCEVKKAIDTLNLLSVKGFNVHKNLLGFWNTQKEKSFNIEIISSFENPFNDNQARDLKIQLENNLKQFLVLTTKQEINLF